jgi:hypothetical protein
VLAVRGLAIALGVATVAGAWAMLLVVTMPGAADQDHEQVGARHGRRR